VTAKYSTDGDDSHRRRWESDRRYVFAEWSTKPFVGHRHSHETVEQRLVIEYTHGVGVDIIHEARSTDTPKFDDEWAPVETVEVREYGARHTRHPHAGWLE
jgi:hypothetical protein